MRNSFLNDFFNSLDCISNSDLASFLSLDLNLMEKFCFAVLRHCDGYVIFPTLIPFFRALFFCLSDFIVLFFFLPNLH